MALPLLTLQLLAVANISLQIQDSHDSLAGRNSWDNSYDYVVVGAGTAGCVVAARLSENPNWKVLLVETGGGDNVISDIPAMYGAYDDDPDLDWGFYTVPEKVINTFRRRNTTYHFRSGRMIGGSSGLSGMNYIRGPPQEYDNWELIGGAKGWSFVDVLPHYMNLERQTDPKVINLMPNYHGMTGPVSLSTIDNYATNPWFDILAKSGYTNVVDFNSASDRVDKAYGIVQQTIANGRRVSMATAYLQPNKHRPNLHILSRSLAVKVLFADPINVKRATGIQFHRDGVYHNVTANREVIISAGAVNSPKLLLLSGVGPRKQLDSLAIKVVADLPVGENMHDGLYSEHKMPFNLSRTLDKTLSVQSLYALFVNGSGPLVNYFDLSSYGRFSSKYNRDLEWPDLSYKLFSQAVLTGVMRTASKGSVRLNTTNPFDPPLIDGNVFAEQRDIELMAESVKELYRVVNNTAFMDDFVQINDRSLCKDKCPPNTSARSPCDAFFSCVAVEYSGNQGYFTSTCQMGANTDANAVVDERLRVRGLQALRVIDASVMPSMATTLISYAAAIMIGEKGAQMISDDNS